MHRAGAVKGGVLHEECTSSTSYSSKAIPTIREPRIITGYRYGNPVWGVVVEDKRCSLTVLKTVLLYLRDPRWALQIEKREWGMYLAGREARRLGLTRMYEKLHPVAYRPDWVDLLNIYNLVRRRKPKVIVEFGSGCSTIMFAKALADNHAAGDGFGALYSVETSEHFKKYTESYIPQDLRSHIEMIHSGIELGEVAGKRVMWHRTVPDVSPNLVYLDGPDYQDFSSDVETQADGVMLEDKAPADYAILIDGRRKTFEFTRSNLKRSYKESVNRTHFWELLEPANEVYNASE